MKAQQYDIFSGVVIENAVWLEVVEELGTALNRIKELATIKPGAYFIFCRETQRFIWDQKIRNPAPLVLARSR